MENEKIDKTFNEPTTSKLKKILSFLPFFYQHLLKNVHPFFPVEGQHGQLNVERVSATAAGRASWGAGGATAVGWVSAKVLPSDPTETTKKNMEVSNL